MGKVSKKKTTASNETDVVVGDVTKKSGAPAEPTPQVYLGATPKDTFSKKQKLWFYGVLVFLVLASGAWLVVNRFNDTPKAEISYAESIKQQKLPANASDEDKVQYTISLTNVYINEGNCQKAMEAFNKLNTSEYVFMQTQQLEPVARCYVAAKNTKVASDIYVVQLTQLTSFINEINNPENGYSPNEAAMYIQQQQNEISKVQKLKNELPK